jgi:hypothetical protein
VLCHAMWHGVSLPTNAGKLDLDQASRTTINKVRKPRAESDRSPWIWPRYRHLEVIVFLQIPMTDN